MSEHIPGTDQTLSACKSMRPAHLLALTLFALLTCVFGLWTGPRMGDHECINAIAAQNALRGGSWLIPELGDVPLIRKMPLGVWAIGASSAAAGVVDSSAREVTPFTARLPSAIAGVLTALVVYWLGSMMFGATAGLVAGVICAGSPALMFFARNAQVDMILGLFCTLALACLYRAIYVATHRKFFLFAAYGAFGMAMMAKAPLPLTMVGLPAAVYWVAVMPLLGGQSKRAASADPAHLGSLRENQSDISWFSAAFAQLRSIFTLWSWPGMALFVVLVGAWPAYIYANVENAGPLWRIEYLDRFSGELGGKEQPWWYYLPLAFGFVAPFMMSLPEGVAAAFLAKYRERRDGLLFALTWAVVGTLFVSLAAFKRPHYLVAVFPAYCLLLAPVIERLFYLTMDVRRMAVRVTCLALPVILAGGMIAGASAVRKADAELIAGYTWACAAAWLFWTAAGALFAMDRRRVAFWLTALALPIAAGVFWKIDGPKLDTNSSGVALEEGLKQHGIGPTDEVYWMEGQPKWSVAFYSGVPLKRMVNEVEVSSLRRGRAKITPELIAFTEKRVAERLATGRKMYLIVSAGLKGMMLRKSDQLREVFALSGHRRDPEDEMVVLVANDR